MSAVRAMIIEQLREAEKELHYAASFYDFEYGKGKELIQIAADLRKHIHTQLLRILPHEQEEEQCAQNLDYYSTLCVTDSIRIKCVNRLFVKSIPTFAV